MIIFLHFILLFLYLHSAISVANLKNFETLTHVSVTSSIKRAADGSRLQTKRVMFRAFERDFDLTLKSDTHLMAKNFRARLVHQNGSSSMLTMDENLIYSGYITDKPQARVNAHIEDTLWSFQIFDEGDIFAVEPAWRLLTPAENPRNDTLIAYRASDLTSDSFNSSKFCGVADHKTELSQENRTQSLGHAHIPHHHSHHSQDSSTDSRGRKKRLSSSGVTCRLYLVGDTTFYKGRCRSNYKACLALMFAYTQLADQIFRESKFVDRVTNVRTDVGLKIGEVTMFNEYSNSTDRLPKHFNENQEWTVSSKLDMFAVFVGIVTHRKPVCTSHLFTDYPFQQRVLGLAWMNSVCLESTPGYVKKSSGLTSGTESQEGAIPSLQMNLVFVHGHNFGSEHDENLVGCSFPQPFGGNFVMWSRSVNGKSENNLKFSPCSREKIGTLISHLNCFIPRSTVTAFCGNGIVDPNEQCDAGALGVIDTDLCCTNGCKFRGQASCSDLNQACCRNCIMAPNGTLCLPKDFIECENASYCTGKSYKCPKPAYLEDWTSCKDRGKCYRGICRGFCETLSIKNGLNLKGCLCETNENGAACKWCCYDAKDHFHPGPCKIYTNDTVHDGRPCYFGYCQKGVCGTYYTSTILRLYQYLPPFERSKLGEFFQSNIVACVILVSLVVGLPMAIYICVKDKQELARNPPPAILYETEGHKHRTSDYRARRQRKKRKREMKEAARSKPERSSFLLELKPAAPPAPPKKITPKKEFTWDQAEQNIPPQFLQ